MKTSMIILFILVSLSLVFSLISFVILVESHISFGFGGSEGTPIKNSPTPTPIPPSKLSISYYESNREEIGGSTKVTIHVNATFINGTDVNFDYSQFYLGLYAPRVPLDMPAGSVYPLNNGTFELGFSHMTETFQLNFEFSTSSFNGMDNSVTHYKLEYNGSAPINWINHALM